VRFCGFLPRRNDDADCTLLAGTTKGNKGQQRQGAAKMGNHARSAATKVVNVWNTTSMIKNKTLLTNFSGQLPFLGLIDTAIFL